MVFRIYFSNSEARDTNYFNLSTFFDRGIEGSHKKLWLVNLYWSRLHREGTIQPLKMLFETLDIFFFFFLILREDILLRWVLLFYQVILRKQNWIDFSFQILIVSKLFFRMKGFFLSLLNTKLTENKYIECRIRKLAVNLKMPKVLEFLECCNFWNPCQDFTNHMHIKKVIVLGPLLFFYG